MQIIHGSHFAGILRATARLLGSKYADTNVELVCDSDKEIYILRTIEESPVIIANLEY